ncbi:MAG: hypothetical protein ACLFTH_00635 [Candidatus Woesearchaeota archaeon]
MVQLRFFDILAFVLILGASFLIYSPHDHYEGPFLSPFERGIVNGSLGHHPFPLHVDGWNHVSLSKAVVDSDGLYHSNPQLAVNTKYHSLEWGFHLLVGFLSLLFGISVLKLSVVLPSLFFLLGAFMWYVFIGRQLKRPLAALVSIAFFALIPANANLLGHWFFIPLTTLWFFLSSFAIILHSRISLTARFTLAGILLLISFSIYPFATLLMLALLFFITLWHYRSWFSMVWSKRKLAAIGVATVVFSIILVLIASGVFDMLVFEKGWTAVEYDYPVSYFVPWILVLIAVSGVFLMWDDGFQWLSLFTGFFLAHGLVSFLTYHVFGFTVLLPFQRMVFVWQLLAGLAIGFAIECALRRVARLYELDLHRQTLYSLLLAILILGLLVAWQLPGYYEPEPERFAITSFNSDAYLQIIDRIPADAGLNVLSHPLISTSIYPLTGNKVVSVSSGNLGGQDSGLYDRFLMSDCKTKSELLGEHGIEYIITDNYFDCPYISEKAFANGLFLYKTV